MDDHGPSVSPRVSRRALFGVGAASVATAAVAGAVTYNWIIRDRGVNDRKATALRFIASQAFPGEYNPDDERLGLSDREFEEISDVYDQASSAIDRLVEAGETDWTQRFNLDGNS